MKITRSSSGPNQPQPIRSKDFTNPRFRRKYFKIKRFVDEYMIDLSPLKAWRRCGLSTGNNNNDAIEADRALQRPEVQQLIAERMDERVRKTELTSDKILAELRLLAFCDLAQISDWDGDRFVLKPFSELTRDQIAIISSIKITPQTFGGLSLEFKVPSASDKKEALVMLGKHIGMWQEGGFRDEDPVEFSRKTAAAAREMMRADGIDDFIKQRVPPKKA